MKVIIKTELFGGCIASEKNMITNKIDFLSRTGKKILAPDILTNEEYKRFREIKGIK